MRVRDTWSGDIAWMEFCADICVTVHDLGFADDAAFIADTVTLEPLHLGIQTVYTRPLKRVCAVSDTTK